MPKHEFAFTNGRGQPALKKECERRDEDGWKLLAFCYASNDLNWQACFRRKAERDRSDETGW
jgi:hypothetical protein